MDLYSETMQNIGARIALQSIRKVIKGVMPPEDKLKEIIEIVHSFEKDNKEEK